MDFRRAINYLQSFVDYEKMVDVNYDENRFNLEKVKRFLGDFGVEYKRLRFVHVAGSKGKGSVANLIADYLSAIGQDTGLYTSPHIVDLRERIQINGEMISKEIFVLAVSDFKEFVDSNPSCDLTYFEILTVLALKIFVEKGVKYAVLEVGLGGRVDATNVVVPELSLLTRVEMEHKGILGDTLEEILNEKLGIVKEGVPLVVGAQSSEVRGLIEKKLKGKDNLYFVEGSFDSAFAENGRLAFIALRVLLGETDQIVFDRVYDEFSLIGRFDIREIDGRTVVFDVAHTVNSAKNLLRELDCFFSGKKLVFLISMMKGKQIGEILNMISEVAEKIVFTNSHEQRGMSAKELAKIIKGEVEGDCLTAYQALFDSMKKDQVLVVTGSSFLVGKILKQL